MEPSSTLTPVIFDVISGVGIILAIMLIGIIITKTPKTMKRSKTYLLFYGIHLLGLEISIGIYSPSMLHPYVFFYPLGLAKYLSQKWGIIIFCLAFYHAMSLYDCSIAIILERYYAMKNISRKPSKIPLYVFIFLSIISAIYLTFVFVSVFYQPLHELYFVSVEENQRLLESIFGVNQIQKSIVDTIFIFPNYQPNTLPFIGIVLLFTEGCRLPIMFLLLFLTAKLSKSLKAKISQNLEKVNQMFFYMIILQFFGIIIFFGIPYLIIFYVSLYVKEPISMPIVSYCFAAINCFGIYDALIVIYCIKPYREFCASWLQFCFRRQRKISLISSSSPPLSIKSDKKVKDSIVV